MWDLRELISLVHDKRVILRGIFGFKLLVGLLLLMCDKERLYSFSRHEDQLISVNHGHYQAMHGIKMLDGSDSIQM